MSYQLSSILDAFLQLIPHRLSSKDFHLSPKAFVRQSKLTLSVLFIFLLSLTASGKSQGVDGKGHDPQCLVSTAYDVFRRLPVARTVPSIANANEREEVKALLPQISPGGVLLFDRGYPSDDLIGHLLRHDQGHWVIRGPAAATFPAVEALAQSGQTEAILTLMPPKAEPITLRAVRMTSPEGELSMLLTNLQDLTRFPAAAVTALYFRRWAVETHDRDEKTSLDIETFHSQTENGIRQELFAILIMAVIARLLAALRTDPDHPTGAKPQFKQAMITLAQEAFVLTPKCPELAMVIFAELLNEIARVRYYPPKTPRPSQPRVSRKPVNKWQVDQAKRMAEA
jgi:hypothetical protein